jgi:hypothetical protein
LPEFRSHFLAAALSALALAAVTGCGSSGASTSTTVTGISSCLQKAGYGVTVVPTSQIAAFGPENRGPGQTGELLVARQGVKPSIGSDSADAVVAFWKSASLAKNSPNAKAKGLGLHADAIGSITVQATTHLVLYAVKAAKTVSGRQAAFRAQVSKIQSCVG